MDDNQNNLDQPVAEPADATSVISAAPYEQQEPPIVRPEDVVGFIEEPVNSMGQTFAPQPEAVAGNSQDTWAEPLQAQSISSAPENIENNYNPAMVPDPLMPHEEGSSEKQEISEERNRYREASDSVPRQVRRGAIMNKRIWYIVGGVVALILIAVGGFFGYQLYAKSQNAGILQAAFSNLANMKGATNTVTLGLDSESFTGKMEIDQDQGVRVGTTISGVDASLIYLKSKDKLYVSDITGTDNTSYTEFDSVKKGIESLSSKTVNVQNTNELSTDFAADDMKSVARGANESSAGLTLYKYTITPTRSLKEKLLADLAGKDDGGYQLSSDSFSMDIWIDAASKRITHVKGSASYAISTGTETGDISGKLSFEDVIDYSFADTISLPDDAKIASKSNLAEILDSGVLEGSTGANSGTTNTNGAGTSDEQDAALIAKMEAVQAALKQYFTDNKAYPSILDFPFKLVGAAPYISTTTEADGLSYTGTGQSYELSFLLNNQATTETTNIKTTSGKKYYFLNADSSTTDTADNSDTDTTDTTGSTE